MGSAGRPEREMQEVFRDSSSQKMQKHEQLIASFVERGYEVESQEEFEDKGAGNELISSRVVTVLKPVADFSLPLIKFEASEKFGDYFDDNEEFFPYDEPRFELKAMRKGADVKSFRDPWQPFDLGM